MGVLGEKKMQMGAEQRGNEGREPGLRIVGSECANRFSLFRFNVGLWRRKLLPYLSEVDEAKGLTRTAAGVWSVTTCRHELFK